jgi:hypothetical protein
MQKINNTRIFVNALRTHTLAFILEVNFIFQLVSEQVHSV